MRAHCSRRLLVASMTTAFVLSLVLWPSTSISAADQPAVVLEGNHGGPRELETLTRQAVVRDYGLAWRGLNAALAQGAWGNAGQYFTAEAQQHISDALASERQTGIRANYENQQHRISVVFYAPEGDVMELHDTAEFDLRLTDAGKAIHSEHVTMHYVVLVTPAADRWVVRQLQAVPDF
jgi:hypothetical protein